MVDDQDRLGKSVGAITVARMSDPRRLVYVSGAPGSGKTSLAAPLATELGYALLSKDRIKERLHDALGAPEPDLAWSRKLGGAAMELLWALAADAPAVVLEANFRPHSQYERAKLSGLASQPIEVHCACPPELAVARYNARVTHPVHVVTRLQLKAMAEFDRPVGIGTLVTVDTAVTVDVGAVAAAVRSCYEPVIKPRSAD
jgi:predicted kinase